MEKVVEEVSDNTSPADMEKGVNNEVDDENKRNFIEQNDTKLNDEDEDSTEVEYKEENITAYSEISTIAKNDVNLNGICEGKEMNY